MGAGGLVYGQKFRASAQDPTASQPKFKLRYGPHTGTFKASAGDDIIDQIKFAADQGFTGWEDNGLPKRPPELQERIGKTVADLGIKMGVFVAYANFDRPVFAVKRPEHEEDVLKSIREAVDVAKGVGTQWCNVLPGSVHQQVPDENPDKYGGGRLAEGHQTANVIELLRRCCEILEPHKPTMVLEPINWEASHGGVFLRHSDQAHAICRAVNSPSCKILFDIYHQQITEGNLIPNITRCWDEIGGFQCGDNPGRKEPGTGEINYRNVFKYIYWRSQREKCDFVVGMEHDNSIPGKEGEQALIKACRDADSF